ncbi:hypothetical protein ACF0H5_022556 [Mactra antiquata]
MRTFTVVAFFAIIACIYADSCNNNADCVNHGVTNCGGNSHVVCENSINQCVCVTGPSGTSCTQLSDCPDCTNGRNKHCVDGTCRCTFF